MDESMLVLLEKSKMFNSFSRGFSAEAKAISLEGFSFWLPCCFDEFKHVQDDADGPLKRFKYGLNSFFKKYLETWITQNKQSKEAKAATEDIFSVANFLGDLGKEEYFTKLKSGKEVIEIHDPISNAKFRFKRVGDLLVFNIYRPGRNHDEEHSSGKKAVLALCRLKDSSNNQGVYELVQRVEITLEIPEGKHSDSGNGKTYSLSKFCKEIVQALYRISVKIPSEQLIDNYHNLKSNLFIGEWHGLQITACLTHPEATDEKEHIAHDGYFFRDRAFAWRRGNLIRISDSDEVNFSLTENCPITLKISIEGSLSQKRLSDYPLKKYKEEQFLIADVGSMVAMSLGIMMLDRHDKVYYKDNSIKK